MWSKSTVKSRVNAKPTKSKRRAATCLSSKKTAVKVLGEPYHATLPGTASIFDLQPEDKTKIGNLIRKVVELDTECKTSEQKAKESQRKLKKQVTALKSQNSQIIKQHSKLRGKFQQSLKLLQNYQMKLNQMDTLQTFHSQHRKSIPKEQPQEDRGKYAEEIQKEISQLKQLILDLHQKEEMKQKQKEQPKEQSTSSIASKGTNHSDLKRKREINPLSESSTTTGPTPRLRTKLQSKTHQKSGSKSRESMVYQPTHCISPSDSDSENIDNNPYWYHSHNFHPSNHHEEEEIGNLSPIRLRTPQTHHRVPAPHPYPIQSKVPKINMTLSQLRKWSIPSSSSTSPPLETEGSSYQSSPCKPSPELHPQPTDHRRLLPMKKLDRDRIHQLLKIQSGNFKKSNRKNDCHPSRRSTSRTTKRRNFPQNYCIRNPVESDQSTSATPERRLDELPLSSSVDNLKHIPFPPHDTDRGMRRVQSAAILNLNTKCMQNRSQNQNLSHDRDRRRNERIYSEDETDRLSHYEGLDLGLSFPDTLSDSDQDDELLLIQHLNELPL